MSSQDQRPSIGHQCIGADQPKPLTAELQILTETWNRVVAVPYLVYMPEKDRLLMLVSCDYPHRPFVLWSDDRGTTWTAPRAVETESDDPNHHVGVSLTYLGAGHVIMSIESCGRYFSKDFGESWSDPVPKPPMSDGSSWNQWDPYLVDRDPSTGKMSRLWETGWKFDTSAAEAGQGLCPQRPFFRYSEDEGRTWSKEMEVARGVGGGEVALFRAANGDMIAACRTGVPKRYNRPIPEIDHYEGLGIAISTDNGHTWSKLNILYEYGRHHPSLVLMPNGEIVMTYVVRKGYPDTEDGFPQFGIEAVVSRDHGRTWDLEHRYVLAKWAGNRKGENAWWPSSQATSTVLLPDGTLRTAFGTGYRSRPNEKNMSAPRDVGLIKWRIS